MSSMKTFGYPHLLFRCDKFDISTQYSDDIADLDAEAEREGESGHDEQDGQAGQDAGGGARSFWVS